jgi:hypothetical protein
MKIILMAGLVLFSSTLSFAAGVPSSFTYQGIVMNSAGTAPLTSVVSLKLSLYDPTGTCLLYQEQQANIDLSQTNGTFAIQVGSSVGAAKRVSGTDQGLSMTSVFANNGQILAASTTNCTAGYTPATNDIRLLRVAVTNGGSTVTISPDLQINSVPNSMVAETLQGYTPTQLFHAPTVTVLTSGSGTYTVPAGTKYLQVEMVGGGAGGGGSIGASGSGATAGGAGTSTTFGPNLTAGPGSGGGPGNNGVIGTGGGAGSSTVNTTAGQIIVLNIPGGAGGTGLITAVSNANAFGGAGGNTAFGVSTPTTAYGTVAISGSPNVGNGGAGGGPTNNGSEESGGGGGGGGSYIKALINNPSSTYTYSVGTGGTAGGAGGGGEIGGSGGSGGIIIYAY